MAFAPRLAVVDDPRFDGHHSPSAHPERPERLDAARDGLRLGLGEAQRVDIEAVPIALERLRAIHDDRYLRALDEALSDRRYGHLDGDTFFSPQSGEATYAAAGGSVALVDALLDGTATRGFALLRPPGHHAESRRGMGFCLVNHVALAAEHALAQGLERVAVVDWDVHHGNGTQEIFEHDDRVFFASLHEWPLYPGTGAAGEIGAGRGEGHTLNVALPEGSDDDVYGSAFRSLLLPVLEARKPDLILVSAGFDAHGRDPLAGMELSAEMYGAMARSLVELAERLGHGRVAFFLEGGYDLKALEASVRSTVEGALGGGLELPVGRIKPAADYAIARTKQAFARHLP
jgi:acetoin utilization deacetylase AcuC-like enzyme